MEAIAVRRVCIPIANEHADGPPLQVVLVVGGDADWREVARRVLAREGYAVVTASHSGHAMLNGLTAGRIDALVTELAMDDMSGPALAGRLRRVHPDVQALYVAPAGTHECDNVLVRPFTSEDLVQRLREVISQRQPAS